jgi:hypothetical protein
VKIAPPWKTTLPDGTVGYGFWIDELPQEVAAALEMLVDEGAPFEMFGACYVRCGWLIGDEPRRHVLLKKVEPPA